MSLTNCPECNKQISDLAKICPNCGYPIRENNEHRKKDEIVTKKKKVPYILGIFLVVCVVAILGVSISAKVMGNKKLEKCR